MVLITGVSGVDWGADPGADVAVQVLDPLVDAVEAAVAGLQGSDPAGLGGPAVAERIVRIEGLLARLSAHQLECVRVVDERGEAHAAGARSTAAWLRERARLGPGAAAARVALARRLVERPAVMAALADGAISVRHAEVLTRTVAELVPRLADAADVDELEQTLLAAAAAADPLRLWDVCARIRHQAAPQAVVDAEYEAFAARRVSVSRTLDGMVAVDGLLDPLTGETVLAAVHACSAPAGPADARSPGQRRADALGEVCRRALTGGRLPSSGGERPQVLVTIALDSLRGQPGTGPGELGWAGMISGELARRIGCDASVTRIVLDPDSQPLDVGRTTRVVSPAMRRALLVRDRTCQYPGCTVPGQWCDAHHITHWARGGVTALHNLTLLCGFHHTRVHLTGETITVNADGRVDISTGPHVAEHLIDERTHDHTHDHPDRQAA